MTATLNEPIAKRIAKLFCMLGSDHEGEALAALTALKRLFKSEGLTFPDIGMVIESCNGAIEEKKYSDSDAEVILARGVEKGRVEESRKQQAPPEFFDADNSPRWSEIALFCNRNPVRLRDAREREFVNKMAGWLMFHSPSQKQGEWLYSIFVRMGGPHPKMVNFHW